MEVSYYLADPTGNITALVETKVDIVSQPAVAEYILDKNPSCEQVGFVSMPEGGADIELRMAGGEFCGNATMSAAALFCKKSGLGEGEERLVKVKASGATGLVNVSIKAERKSYLGTVSMPKPIKISKERLLFEEKYYELPVVSFVGISHVIAEDDMPVYMAERAVKVWADRLKVSALGIMLVNRERTSIKPLVYIKNPETLYWESSCASGTTAAGAYFASLLKKPAEFSFKEPGGELSIEADSEGNLKLSGHVSF